MLTDKNASVSITHFYRRRLNVFHFSAFFHNAEGATLHIKTHKAATTTLGLVLIPLPPSSSHMDNSRVRHPNALTNLCGVKES